MLFPLSVMSVMTSLIIILLCCLVMARYRKLFDRFKIPMAIIAVSGGIILYTIGYLPDDSGSMDPLSILAVALRAIFSTCRIFISESDVNDVNAALQSNGAYLLAINLVQILGVSITIMAVLSSLGVKFLSRLKLIFTNAKKIYVFMGFNDASENLIKDLKENDDSRCFIVIENLKDTEDGGDLIIKLREDRFILIDTSWKEATSLRRLRIPYRLLKREVHVFALSDEENMNVRVILNLIKQSGKEKIKDDSIHFYINSSDEGAEKVIEAANEENGTRYEYKIFNPADLTARQLFNTYPIHDYIEIDTTKARALSGFTIFIAGLGATGVEILRKSIYLGQFIGGSYRAIITDDGMVHKRGNLFNRFPELKNNYNIETYEAHPGCEDFYNVLSDNIDDISYIVVAMDDDTLNMKTAVEIQRLVKRSHKNNNIIIAVHIKKQEQYEHLSKYPLLENIRFFGRNSDIFTESIIINESMDKMARKINALYNSIYNIIPADNWPSLDSFTKESNRSAASNINTKLRLLGLTMVERGENNKNDAAQSLNDLNKPVNLMEYLEGERLDNLAKQEHLRWNAFHFASGWTTWLLNETGDAKKAKDLKNKRHACLVSWEELSEVTAHFRQNPSYQELDYEQVKFIPRILDHAGYDVVERK